MTEQEPDGISEEALDLVRTYVETEHGFLSWLGFTVEVESETPDGGKRPVAVGQGAYRLFQG